VVAIMYAHSTLRLDHMQCLIQVCFPLVRLIRALECNTFGTREVFAVMYARVL
jgi:hypothetical protein